MYPAYIDTPGFQHAANYVGKKLKPVPPVFPAKRVAKTMVRLASRPRNSAYVGETALLFKKMNQAAPGLTRSMMSGIMENYFGRAKDAPVSNGHVMEPGTDGTGISGGWLQPRKNNDSIYIGGLFLAGVAAGLWLTDRKRAG